MFSGLRGRWWRTAGPDGAGASGLTASAGSVVEAIRSTIWLENSQTRKLVNLMSLSLSSLLTCLAFSSSLLQSSLKSHSKGAITPTVGFL